ncbi:hypothetical protein JHK82_014648 [Glycine max]|uniref:Uncharacterized protein n=1 Tax=Glycine max TaxID=3847 RepID=A0A0R0JDM1_SOYBN|nr:hypothetical protein JHK87_014564 [Glycine soja]KAG5031033.1 hypothetical protein JHK85_015015 [Glycine max]KAG5147767.1 hypothetical protein JHK82_014648 [Glycine max]KAH1124673.1 hypothetical protein GYH30_014383 [Glycine max]KRH52592.1 hypothetical protein GLYMA_06G076300v4 [Glycine max]
MGWGWAGVIWLYCVLTYIPLDILKFAICYVLSGKAWNNLLENKTTFTTKRLWQRRERSTVGNCTEDSSWSSAT